MYDFNEGQPLSGLLEQIKGAAVLASGGVVTDYNSTAGRMLPELRTGDKLVEPENGVIELGGARFEAVSFELGEETLYTFAVPAQTAVDAASPLLENVGMAIMDSLNSSFAAAELIAGTAEREQLEPLGKYNAILRHEQHRLLHIAENLRELSALAGAEDVLSRSLFELDELCEKAVESVSALVRDKGIGFRFETDGADFMVYADERRIERMLLELLANSVEKCGAGCTVSISLKREGSQYLMLVEDNGPGISGELYSEVFDTYTRPIRPEDGPRGIGLSLTVARNVALRHGGNLVLQSKEGEGTRVLVTLPIVKPESTELHSGRVNYASNPMRPVLTALADVLDYKYYAPPYL